MFSKRFLYFVKKLAFKKSTPLNFDAYDWQEEFENFKNSSSRKNYLFGDNKDRNSYAKYEGFEFFFKLIIKFQYLLKNIDRCGHQKR